MATSSGGGGGNTGQDEQHVDHEHRQRKNQSIPKASYASKVTGNKATNRQKLNVLDIFFERKNDSISYNLSKEELAKLIFKKMCIDPKSILKIDTSGFGRINIELVNSVNLESMINLPVFEIREGLRTKFYRPHHRKESLVTISWLDIETPDSLVAHVMSHFGNLKSDIQWVKFKKEENESELASMLNTILSGERQVWMEIDKPIPSYGIIDGRKVKIYYPGQRRTCARCQKTADQCLGNSNAKLCDERGGDRVGVEIVWKSILEKIGYVDYNEEKEITQETEENTEIEESEVVDKNPLLEFSNYLYDGLILSNLPEDISNEDLEELLEKHVLNCSDKITILSAESSRSRFIKTNDKDLISEFMKMNNKTLRGRLVHCHPHIPATPPKPKATANDTTEAKEDEPTRCINVTEVTLKEPSTIPGLTEAEKVKAKKSAEKRKKSAAAKERRRQKKEEQEKEGMKKLSKEDFLEAVDGNGLSVAEIVDKFDFSEYSTDENDLFEDSKEEVSGDESCAPVLQDVRKQSAFSQPEVKGSKRSISSPGQDGTSKKQKQRSVVKPQ